MNPEIKIFGTIGDPEDGTTAKQFDEQLSALKSSGEIDVLINSNGGSVSEGIAIADAMLNFPGTVNTIIVGGAYSIAGYIACAGTGSRKIRKKGLLHIHGPQQGTQGNLQDHEDSIEELKIATKVMGEHYAEITGRDYDEIVGQFHRDRFLDADQAVELGFMTAVDDSGSPVVPMQAFKQINGLPRKFAAALLQAEPEHSPESKPMAAATLKELKAKFKNATAQFYVDQLDAEATLETATANYINNMEANLESARAESTKLKKQMEAMEDESATAMDDDDDLAIAMDKDELIAELRARIEAMEESIGMDMDDDDDDDDMYAMDDESATAMDDDEEIEALRAQVAALKKKQATAQRGRQRKPKRRGARAVRKARSRGPGRKTAAAEVDSRVKAMIADNSGMSKHDAAQAVYKADPDLRKRYVEEANQAD